MCDVDNTNSFHVVDSDDSESSLENSSRILPGRFHVDKGEDQKFCQVSSVGNDNVVAEKIVGQKLSPSNNSSGENSKELLPRISQSDSDDIDIKETIDATSTTLKLTAVSTLSKNINDSGFESIVEKGISSRSSSSTVGYNVLEETHHKEQENQIKLKLGGIQLDYSLIGKEPAKRGCTLKENLSETAFLKKKGRNKRKKQLTSSRRDLDLPVASPTSKILSWNCVSSTPVKESNSFSNVSQVSISLIHYFSPFQTFQPF